MDRIGAQRYHHIRVLSKQLEINGRFALFTYVTSFVLGRLMYVSRTVIFGIKLDR